jgi:hypothetical protein
VPIVGTLACTMPSVWSTPMACCTRSMSPRIGAVMNAIALTTPPLMNSNAPTKTGASRSTRPSERDAGRGIDA